MAAVHDAEGEYLDVNQSFCSILIGFNNILAV